MCGIIGAYSPNGFKSPDELTQRLETGLGELKHRGPDATGITIRPQEGVAFGHTRLSIIDLDPRSNQPMICLDGSVVLTFNGEIYNYKLLRNDLQAAGAQFQTESDTEVLLAGYRIWGLSELLKRIAGMFAFALYDAKKKSVFLVRDRAGKKPLFYCVHQGTLYFSSELKGLKALVPKIFQINPAGLKSYLHTKYVPSPLTLFDGVYKLPMGQMAIWSGTKDPTLKTYWTPYPDQPADVLTEDNYTKTLDRAMEVSVQRRLVSDVPVCLFLSGGIDSSLIAAYFKKLGIKDMTSYSIGYKNLSVTDELPYAKMVADKFSLKHREIILNPNRSLEILEDTDIGLDEPVSDWVWVPLYQLSQQAHDDGFKVTLLGEGSDEIFFGYDSMAKGLREIQQSRSIIQRMMANALTPLLSPIYKVSKVGHRRYDRWRRIQLGEPAYLGSSLGFNESQLHQVLGVAAGGDIPLVSKEFIADLYLKYQQIAGDPKDMVNLLCFLEFHTKMNETLLQRVDRVTMLHSLEARAPFLDHELVETAFRLPGSLKYPHRKLKGALKKLAETHLPHEIIHRKKTGFSFPFKEWLRDDLGKHVESAFNRSRLFMDGWVNKDFAAGLLKQHRQGFVDNAPKIWMIYDLCRWYDRWGLS